MRKITGFIFLLVFLSGCLMPTDTTRDTVLRDELLVSEELQSKEQPEKQPQEQPLDEVILEWQVEWTKEEKEELLRKQQDYYAFSTLGVTEQNLYVEILYALEHYVEEMVLSSRDMDEIDRIFQYVMLDHPEIFYADGYSFVKYTLGEEVKKVTFTGNYIYNEEERSDRESKLEEAVQRFLEGIDPDASDYEKVKAVYERVISRTDYDREAEDNQNICSVFLNGESVCQGYAKAVQYLLGRLNVPSVLVLGTVENSEGHAWNLVRLDNEYYYVDATWGDASYISRDGEGVGEESVPKINYDFLCVTTEDLSATHSFSNLLELPVCNARENNYFWREGAYFTAVDSKQLEELAGRYYEEGRETLTVKCSDREVYDDMLTNLLDEQKVFDYLKPEGNSIQYTDSPEQLSITFWL